MRCAGLKFLLLTTVAAATRPKPLLHSISPKHLMGFDADSVFDRADSNQDGRVSLFEFYAVMMSTYIQANRMGMLIDPPSREVVEAMFERADDDDDGLLSRDEFHRLSPILEARLGARLLTFVTVRFVVSPYLAWTSVGKLASHPWIDRLRRAVPERLAAKAGHLLFSDDVWRTVFVIFFMSVLGKLAMWSVNAYLASLPFAKQMLDSARHPSARKRRRMKLRRKLEEGW